MKQITEDYVSYETATLLKEKGFNENTLDYYDKNGTVVYGSLRMKRNDFNDYARPTHQMALKWLREVHNLHIWFGHSVNKGLAWYYEIHGISDGKVKHIGGIQCGSYEVACEAALKYTLENLI